MHFWGHCMFCIKVRGERVNSRSQRPQCTSSYSIWNTSLYFKPDQSWWSLHKLSVIEKKSCVGNRSEVSWRYQIMLEMNDSYIKPSQTPPSTSNKVINTVGICLVTKTFGFPYGNYPFIYNLDILRGVHINLLFELCTHKEESCFPLIVFRIQENPSLYKHLQAVIISISCSLR